MSSKQTALERFSVGDRIYYTGDMANPEHFGTIAAVHGPSRFAALGNVDIRLDDGREFRQVHPVSFDPSPGRRFWLLDEWKYENERQRAAMHRRLQDHLAELA